MPENIFAEGVSYFAPGPKAPDYIKGTLAFNVSKFIEFMDQHAVNNWLKVDIKESQKGNIYLSLNLYKPKEKTESKAEAPKEIPGVTYDKINEEGEDAGNEEIPF